MKTTRQVEKVFLKKHGAPNVLESKTFELVPNSDNGLLIEIWLLGIGFADIMAQRGGYALAPKLPFSPGYDFVGRIIDAYDSPKHKNGDMVCGMLPTLGTYADILEVKEEYLVKMPKDVSVLKTAAAILNYLTAYCIIEKKANSKKNDTVFIQGASGGVGLALSQIGAMKGLKMYGTASQSKFNLLKSNNVIPIDYKSDNFVKIILTNHPKGIDASFDARGGKDLKNAGKVISSGGTVVTYGFSGSGFGGNKEMFKGLWQLIKIMFSPNGKKVKTCGMPHEIKKDTTWYRAKLETILELIKKGKLNPQIDSVFDLNNAIAAHERFEKGNLNGKIILKTKYYND